MSATAVLLCSAAGLDGAAPTDAVVLDDLCGQPAAAAAALRATGTSRVVLGLCERRPPAELVAALRRAGAAPFGIETVSLRPRSPAEAARLVAAARARLDALPSGELGRAILRTGAISRRSLFTPGGAFTHVPVATIDEAACLGTSRCGLCVGHCPAAAIAGTTPFPTIDAASCSACGRCVPRCPRGALRLAGAAAAQIEAQLEQLAGAVDSVVFACAAAAAEAPPGSALVELPALALVSPGWILQLRTRGVAVHLAPCDGPCCDGVSSVAALAERVLAAAGEPPEPEGGRIELTEPRATVEAIRRLARVDAVLESTASPLGIVTLEAARCTLCGACASACPTEALRLSDDSGRTTLHLAAAACIACSRCANACPEDALEIRPGLDLGRLEEGRVELATAWHEACAACGADLPPGPMRRRLREILPELAGAPLDLCARCGRTYTSERSSGEWQQQEPI